MASLSHPSVRYPSVEPMNPSRFWASEHAERFRDFAFFLAWAIIGGSGPALRILGGLPFVLAVGLLIYSGGRYYWHTNARIPLMFSLLALLYVFLSFFHVLPGAWTIYYEPRAIVNQSASVVTFGFMVIASWRWWDRVRLGRIPRSVLLCLLFLCFVIAGLVQVVMDGGQFLSTLRNSTLAFFVIASYFLFRGKLIGHLFILLGLLASFTGTASFLQIGLTFALLFSFYGMTLLKLPVGRIASAVFVILTLGVALYGLSDIRGVWEIDVNTAWRLAFWRDVFRSVEMTMGIGVGFGTEALANFYADLHRDFLADVVSSRGVDIGFLLIGTHNGYSDTLFRMGIVGAVLLVAIFHGSRPAPDPVAPRSNHTGFIFVLAFLCTFTNVALQSPLYAAGVAFALGYTRSVRGTVRAELRTSANTAAGVRRVGAAQTSPFAVHLSQKRPASS